MKVAIPLYKDRVAPHFGASSEVLLVEIQGASVEREAIWNVGGDTAFDVARRLLDLGVEKIVCGGINRIHKEWLTQKGVTVLDNRKGKAKEVLEELLASR